MSKCELLCMSFRHSRSPPSFCWPICEGSASMKNSTPSLPSARRCSSTARKRGSPSLLSAWVWRLDLRLVAG